MLLHLRALPEPAISPRNVRDGMGAAPGSLMRPYFAGSRITSNSSGFWPHSQGVSKRRTEKALITHVARHDSTVIVMCNEARFSSPHLTKNTADASRLYVSTAARFLVTFVGAFPSPTLAARNETTATSASQSKPTGIRNVPAIEQGMVLSPSLPPRAARPAPSLGRSRAAQILGQPGRQRSVRLADRPM